MWKIESIRLIATIARVTHDIGIAEELAQGAVVTALELWPEEGIPENPGAWLMTAAKRRATDSPKSILDNIEIVGTPPFRHVSSVNLPYLTRCRQRTISYWDCYYRGAISRYLDYPGFRSLMRRFERRRDSSWRALPNGR